MTFKSFGNKKLFFHYCCESNDSELYIFPFVLSAHNPERRGCNPIYRGRVICTPAGVHWRATWNGIVEQPACSIRGSMRSLALRRCRSAKCRRSALAATDSWEPDWRWESLARKREACHPGTECKGSLYPARHQTVPSSRTPEIAVANARKQFPGRNGSLQE